jgi:hypothetical protein
VAIYDSIKPVALVAALATTAAAGFAVGYLVARDPETLRRWARALAGGVERTQIAFAEAYENLADLWADVRDDARRDIEEHAMGRAAGVAAAASNAAKRSTRATAQSSSASRRRGAKQGKVATRARRKTAAAPDETTVATVTES